MNELNEKELQYIISEVSNSLLNEIKVMDAYQKYYSDVPSYVWEEMIGRLQKDRNGNFVNDLLPETKWVLKLYKAKSPRLVEDLYKLKNENGDGYLDIFLRAKERRMIQGVDGDLNRFKSIAELGAYVSSLDVDTILGRTKGEMSNAVHEAKDDIEKLYEDDEWIILIPKTHEASCYWAKGAHWCTAYRDSDEYFKEYSSQGPLFMNINKENPQLSTQFHLESDQYMDYYDNAIEDPIFERIHDGDTLLDFYQNYLPAEKFIKMLGSDLGNGLYAAYLYDYDYGEEGHDDEYAYFMVDINMNRLGGPFEDMYNFNGNDVTRVIYNDSKYNLVDTKGKLQFDEPLIDIKQVRNLKNKFVGKTCNASSMDDDGNITTKEKSHIVAYDNGQVIHFYQYNDFTCYGNFTLVRGKDNFNILNYDFQPRFKHDYLNIRPFALGGEQYFAIQKMNKWNLSDISGNILWDNWVYDITPNLTINGLPIKTFKVNTGIGLNLYDVNGNPMMGEDVEKFTWSNWKTDGVVSGVMMLNGDYNFLDNKFNIIDRDGKILYKGLYEPMNESRKTLNENYHGEIYHFTSLIQGSWIVDDDALYANISQSDECEGVSDNRKYIDSNTPFISFTRDKNYSIQGNDRSLVCFVFDGDDIQKIRNARLYPFSYGGYGREESEERVYGVNIKPLHKYLKRIEIKLSNKPYSWSSDRQFDEEDDLYGEFETKYPELSQKEIDKMISDYLVDKISKNKLIGTKVVIKNNVNENRRILNEITVQDASKRFYSDIPANDFMEIINTLQSGNQILLPDTKWALALYKKKSPRFMEDLYKLHNENGDGYLDIFNRLKTINKIQGAESDLGRYKSISELGAFINAKMNELGDEEIWGDNAYRKKKNMSDDVKSAKDDIKVLYEDDTWLILTPNSYEASVYWGDGTEWCTAYKDDRKYYDRYSKEGVLYININKKTGEKFQFHFETESFMDANDYEINCDDSPVVFDNMQGVTKGMEDFYAKTLDSWQFQYLTGYNEYNVRSLYDPEERAYYLVKRGSDKPISDYYGEIEDFEEGFAIVYSDEKAQYNFINFNGELLSEVWFDDCNSFSNGYAVVSFGINKWNYINTNGELLLKKNVHHAISFLYGFGRICYDNKYNLVTTDGKVISKIWFDEIGYFTRHSILVRVCLHNKYNFIKKDGELIGEQWWDVASSCPIDGDNFTVANYSDGIIYFVNNKTCEINKSDENLQTQSELSKRAFWENTQKLDINDIRYIISEAKERLLLNEISNNAIETLFKKYIPWVTEIFDLTLKEVRNLGKRPGDTREGIYGMKGAAYCHELGIVDNDIISNPEMKIKDWLRLKIMKEFEINRGRGPIQFIRGIIRICCADDDISLFSRSTSDMANQNTKLNLKKFKQIIGYIMSKNLNFNEDLNGLGFKELNRSIGAKLRHEAYDNWIVEKDKRSGIQQVGEYQVIPMYGFEDTSKYGDYTSWCVTQRRSHYEQYTSDGSQFFFCLKNGFENVQDERGKNCPLDEYGLSMVSVLVRSNGEIKHVTTRWNHDNNGEDNPQLRTFEQIEEVLGIPESLFTVNTAPELDFEDIPALIQKHGIDKVLHTITNVGGFKIVEYNRKRNVIHDNKLLSDKWFDSVETTNDGFFQCINNDHRTWEYNIIDKKGLVFPENFPHAKFKVYNPEKDIFLVDIAGESALYKRGSNFAITEKFRRITKLYDGYARADNYGYYNFYDENGKKIWDEWKIIKIYDNEYWHDGFQRIFNNYGRSNFINIKTGKILLDEWYLETSAFHEGTAYVKNEDGLYNFVKTDGTLVSEKWYEQMRQAGEYYSVKIGEGETFLDKNGQYPIKKTWKHTIYFNGNYGLVRHDNNEKVTVLIDKDGNEIADINMNCIMITKGNAILAFNEEFRVSLFDVKGNYLLPPNLKFTNIPKQNKMKGNCFYFENEKTGEIYELNSENNEINEINR